MLSEGFKGRVRLVAIATACIAAAAALTACGNIKSSSSSSSTSAEAGSSKAADSPASLVPEEVRSSGKLVIGTNVPYPPMEFFGADGKTFEGVDVELIEAIAEGLELKPELVNSSYDGLIPSVVSGRLDVIISGMGDFTDREKQLDFVDYVKTGSEVMLSKEAAANATSLLDLCGMSIGVQAGTDQVAATEEESKRCEAAGKPPLKVETFPEDSDALLAQKSGRVELHAADAPVVAYEAATIDGGKRFVAKFPNFLSTPIDYGIGVSKDKEGLAEAIRDELNALIKDGTYGEILAKYHLQNLAVEEAVINGATVSSTGVK
jgi:polar amino acid transport system substrate-binding protein